jgi:hypothetical protein
MLPGAILDGNGEYTARMAYVDFDGSAALQASQQNLGSMVICRVRAIFHAPVY